MLEFPLGSHSTSGKQDLDVLVWLFAMHIYMCGQSASDSCQHRITGKRMWEGRSGGFQLLFRQDQLWAHTRLLKSMPCQDLETFKDGTSMTSQGKPHPCSSVPWKKGSCPQSESLFFQLLPIVSFPLTTLCCEEPDFNSLESSLQVLRAAGAGEPTSKPSLFQAE